jgi:hypothetical protein
VTDLKNPRVIYFKGFLFLLTGLVSASLLLVLAPSVRVAVLLAICVWCFCRFYYFAFYVIQYYLDEDYKFAGLLDFLIYVVRGRQEERDDRSAD